MSENLHFHAGFKYLKVDKEGTKAVIGKYTKLSDPDGLERTYKTYTAVLPETPYPDTAGVKTLLDDMAPRNPAKVVGLALE